MEEIQDVSKMPRHQRYYLLHREEKINKVKERYHNNPEVIAKKEERERKKAEREAEKAAKKEAEKEAKRQEKERQRQEKLAVALATSKKRKVDASPA